MRKEEEKEFKGFLVEVAPQSNLLQKTRVRVKSKAEVMNLQKNRYEIWKFLEGSYQELPDGDIDAVLNSKPKEGFF